MFHACFASDGRGLFVATPSQHLLSWNLDLLWSELDRRGLAIDFEPRRRAAR